MIMGDSTIVVIIKSGLGCFKATVNDFCRASMTIYILLSFCTFFIFHVRLLQVTSAFPGMVLEHHVRAKALVM